MVLAVVVTTACRKNSDSPKENHLDDPALCEVDPNAGTPYELNVPFFFPDPIIPADNPMTVEGVDLGRYLFWDQQLSRTKTFSCGSCHTPSAAFTDTVPHSVGLYGDFTPRNSMPLYNLAWNTSFFWDGRAATLEEQILEPVTNPIEMDMTWDEVVERVTEDTLYTDMFEAAFGNSCVDSIRITYAMAQFLRTMISADSPFDFSHYGPGILSPSEQRGLELFLAEGGNPETYPGGQQGGDCFHCHGGGLVLFTDHGFRNNGLDTVFIDLGREDVTGSPYDRGKFRTPSLRNVAVTAPYMHDGRFATLREVLEHYNMAGHPSATIDPMMKFQGQGLNLSEPDLDDLEAFLNSLTDTEFLEDERFTNPR